MNKFDTLYNKIINEWVNYTPSYERTCRILCDVNDQFPLEQYIYLRRK